MLYRCLDSRRLTARFALLVSLVPSALQPAFAALTVLSDTPLSSTSSAQVKPNIMLLMDASRSMSYGHMPDEVETTIGPSSVGYKSVQCNALYYDRNQTYLLPKKADQSFFPSPSFTTAPYAGYVSFYTSPDATDQSIVNLNTSFVAYGTKTLESPPIPGQEAVAGKAYYYYHTGPDISLKATPLVCGQLDVLSPTSSHTAAANDYAEVTALDGGKWIRQAVTTTSGVGGNDETTNFAIWYTYYRTRLGLTKSAASLAFTGLTNSSRVGFITVNPKMDSTGTATSSVSASRYLSINDFDATQRSAWFSKLFSQQPGGSSPAREGLARVGRYYAGKTDGINAGMGGGDPMQYSCQQNFTIMTTDGYWNVDAESTNGGPVKLDGTTRVGEQDGDASNPLSPRPIFDGSLTSIRTVKDASNGYSLAGCTGNVALMSTSQKLQGTKQFKATVKVTHKITQQYNVSTSQALQTQKRYESYTTQTSKTTQFYSQNTVKNLQGTQWLSASTSQRSKVTDQYTTSTYTIKAATSLYTKATSQTKKSTVQYTTSTSQLQQTTYTLTLSTSQTLQAQTQFTRRQYQLIAYDSLTETGTPVATCPASSTVSCFTRAVSPLAPIASCTPGTSVGTEPNFVVSECTQSVVSASAPVASCVAGTGPAPSYIITTCTANNTTNVPSATCTPGTTNPSAANNYTTSVCTQTAGDTAKPVSACSEGTGSASPYLHTSCVTVVSPPVGVQTCTVGTTPATRATTVAPDYYITTCAKNAPAAVNVVQGTYSNQMADANNQWIAITYVTTNVAAAPFNGTCSEGTTNTLAFLYTTCHITAVTSNSPYSGQTCTTGNATTSPYLYTLCSPSIASTPVGVQTACTPGTTVGTDSNYTHTVCTRNLNTTYLQSSTACTDIPASNSNGWMSTTCNTATTPDTPVSSCTLGTTNTGLAGKWVYTTCTNHVGSNTPIAGTCAPVAATATNPIAVTCPPPVTTPVANVPVCTPGDLTGPAPDYVHSVCTYTNTTAYVPNTPVCTNQTGDSAHNYVNISCATTTAATIKSPTACTSGVDANYLYTTCLQYDLSSNVPVDTCTAGTGPAPDYVITTCPSPVVSGPTPSPLCTPGTKIAADHTSTTCTYTNNDVLAADQSAAACTAQLPTPDNGYTTISCPTTVLTNDQFVTSCTPGISNTGSPSFQVTYCTEVSVQAPTPVATCTPGTTTDASHVTTYCQDGPTTGPTPMAAGTCLAGNSGTPNYITTTCGTGTAPGKKVTYATTVTTTVTNFSGTTVIGTPTVTPSTGASSDVAPAMCYVTGVDAPPVVPTAHRPAATEAPLATLSLGDPSCTSGWPCTIPSAAGVVGGSNNSLADVAQYYYVTDLRPDMSNDPPFGVHSAGGTGAEVDNVTWQHMTTFTIGLGVSGTLNYRSDYKSSTATTGDFSDIRTGAKDWPIWPTPGLETATDKTVWNDPRSIDDFWHTAVNGRGQYFSAGNANSVIAGLGGALSSIDALTASGSGAGTSTLSPVAGDNLAFVATYLSSAWTGDMQAFEIDLTTGQIGGTETWSAQKQLAKLVGNACDNRTIYIMRNTALGNFTWNSNACDAGFLPTGVATSGLTAAEQAYFSAANVQLLSQYIGMTDGTLGTVDQRTPAAGANLVNFLRGQKGMEGFQAGVANALYRTRKNAANDNDALGDVVDSQPVYVKAPSAAYTDAGYDTFKSSQSGRTPMVYVAANDGMLHAFYAQSTTFDATLGGKEAWAVIPSAVLPNMYLLADNNYKALHKFYVDGTPTVADAYDTSSTVQGWKTILVGGLNNGGKSYYALDVTDPLAPKALWEFKWSDTCYNGSDATAGGDCHLGYTYGNPVISKLTNGTWVVMFTSGYNNVNVSTKAGDGIGYLYVLNAFTGKIIYKISTGIGSAATPSGLAQINNYVDSAQVNNTTLQVYGGDLLGNIWRFDPNDRLPPTGRDATLIGTAKASVSDTVGQPITIRPELAELDGKPMVFVGTGKLLGAADPGDTQKQSIYGIVDTLSGSDPVYTDLRGSLRPLALTQVGSDASAVRTVACTGTTAQCTAAGGWVVDLPEGGERVNVNMRLVLGTLVVGSNVPNPSACSTGGKSWLNFLNFQTGLAVTGTANTTFPNGVASVLSSQSLIVGLEVIALPGGGFQTIGRMSDASQIYKTLPPPDVPPKGKRISWREVAQ